ncbi:hypothetical protein SteCoe_19938 [Stentor coeruleus]|uniref:RBR-type E3 ubiquitin transferase n=1 Tax=Stentor coeruleus TaxID=5963 RepID=A0A1R2BSX7_9CILI|nr:hypothetical protein SteCoe_19938 [Stentor coeruleus]
MSNENISEEKIIFPLEQEKCTICLENEVQCQLLCGHEYCKNCITLYIDTKIQDGEVLKIPCPTMTCSDINESLILQFASPEAVVKYHKFAYVKKLESDLKFRWCPQKECKGYGLYESSNKLKCQECNFEFCFLCADQWHRGECKFLKTLGSFSVRQGKKVKFCPVCYVRTEKNGGCDSIECKKCLTSWCWMCSRPKANHNIYICYVGEKWYNPKISIALILFFLPILIIFFPFALLFVLLINHELVDNSRDKIQTFLLKHSILSLILLFILSPLIVFLMGIGSLFGYSGHIAYNCLKRRYMKNSFWKITIIILFPFIYLGILVLMLIIFPIALVLSVAFGAILILIKIPGSLYACASNRLTK